MEKNLKNIQFLVKIFLACILLFISIILIDFINMFLPISPLLLTIKTLLLPLLQIGCGFILGCIFSKAIKIQNNEKPKE
jgi:hypothetical protein